MSVETGTVVGGYRIEALLGRGGMARVYSARHEEHGRLVALKLLDPELGEDPEFRERFRREGRVQASLEHPHVVDVLDAGESPEGLYLVMRLVPGSTLAELTHERDLDSQRALMLLRQVADGLDAAHAAGLVHRDVKPQNVLVGENDDAYLGDFGLTRVGGSGGVTATGRLMGTIAYLAPEVIRGEEAGPASDIYSFAAMAFECLTGTTVFPRRTEAAILYAHTTEPPPQISKRRPELPQALDAVFAGALSKEPKERPRSAAAFLDQVEKDLPNLEPPPPPGASALEGATVEPVPPPGATAGGRRRGRGLAPWAAAALVGGVLAAGAFALSDSDGSKSSAVPAVLAGGKSFGSDLKHAGKTLDCRGKPVTDFSPTCTIAQSALPGKHFVAPEDGVIRQWVMRNAQGEFALAVLTPRPDGEGQLALSSHEFVGDPGVHVFKTELRINQGDHVGLIMFGGSGIGTRDVDSASTDRWIPRLKGTQKPTQGKGTGFDKELLLRADYIPNARRRVPRQVKGAAAARLEPGKVVKRTKLKFTSGRPVEIRLVQVGRRFALDQFLAGRRTARIDVPEFVPKNGTLLDWEVYAEVDRPQQLGIYMEWRNEESARILNRFYDSFPSKFEYIN